MKRRHRRVLFNLFAFSLLGIAIYLNVFRMNDGNNGRISSSNNPSGHKPMVKDPGAISKITAKRNYVSEP